MQITDATSDDAAEIAGLLNAEAQAGLALWTHEQQTPHARAAWIAARQDAGFGMLVARDDDRFLGFAGYGPFRDKEGYRLTVEHSVYIAPDAQRRGVARALMEALIAHAGARGFHAMIGAVEAGNTASLALHEKLGFRQVGLMPQVGVKFGRWLDLALVQLLLDDRPAQSR